MTGESDELVPAPALSPRLFARVLLRRAHGELLAMSTSSDTVTPQLSQSERSLLAVELSVSRPVLPAPDATSDLLDRRAAAWGLLREELAAVAPAPAAVVAAAASSTAGELVYAFAVTTAGALALGWAIASDVVVMALAGGLAAGHGLVFAFWPLIRARFR